MKRFGIGALGLLALLVTIGLLRAIQPARAQDDPKGTITVWFTAKKEELNGKPVMVSIISNGSVIKQTEKNLSYLNGWDVPPGTYEVRCEGEGMTTIVKRGILVLAKNNTDVQCPMLPGQGVHITEYATGALSREEIAARLAKLESAQCNCAKK